MAQRPVLILEGQGDKEAIPRLIREVSGFAIFPTPKPFLKQSVKRLSRDGELERFTGYALMRDDADSVLFLLDVDEDCAKQIVEDWVPRILALDPLKKVGIGLFVREFESFFLGCLDLIADEFENYGWSLEGWELANDHESFRGAKERLSGFMRKGKSYKPTADQVRFISALNFGRLRDRARSFRHLENLSNWLLSDDIAQVYPIIE